MKNKHIKYLENGEPFIVPADKVGWYGWHTCCDCDLRHFYRVDVDKEGHLIMSWWRDNMGTSMLRKARKANAKKRK